MPEVTPYFETISAAQALRHYAEDEAGVLAGDVLMSLETNSDSSEQDIFTYISENFSHFLGTLTHLAGKDAEILLGYYILNKTQTQIGLIHKVTQTIASQIVRTGISTLSAFILFGNRPPNEEEMTAILTRANIPNAERLASWAAKYAVMRDFAKLALELKVHRPDIRRAFSAVSLELREMCRTNPNGGNAVSKTGHGFHSSGDARSQALGWYLNSLGHKSNPRGGGYNARTLRKFETLHIQLPDILGEFSVDITSPDAGSLFTSQAHRS
jgi:hypothetical protein